MAFNYKFISNNALLSNNGDINVYEMYIDKESEEVVSLNSSIPIFRNYIFHILESIQVLILTNRKSSK